MKKIYAILMAMSMWSIGHAQLQNLDFELWHNEIPEEGFMPNSPVGWIWTNGVTTWEESTLYNPPHTDAQSNDYALTLSVWYNHTKDALIQGAPIDYRPARLKGYYKYTDNIIYNQQGEVVDTALVTVYLTTIGPSAEVLDTIGMGTARLNYSEGYTEFNAEIEYYTDEIPNLITILLDPSLVNRYQGVYYAANPGPTASFFTVDNLTLEGEAVLSTEELNNMSNTTLYPNPATDKLFIQDFEGTAIVYDIAGKQVLSQKVMNGNALDIAALSSGTYQVHLMDADNKQVVKFIKQ